MSGWDNQSRQRDGWNRPRNNDRNGNGGEWGISHPRNNNSNQGRQKSDHRPKNHSAYGPSHSSSSSSTARRPHEGKVVIKNESEPYYHSDQQSKREKKRRSYDTKDNTTKKVKNEDNGDDSGSDGNGTSIPKIKREKLTDVAVKKEEPTSTDLVVRIENTSIVKVEETCGTMTVVEEMDPEEAKTKWKEKIFECYRFPSSVDYLPKEAFIPDSKTTIEKKLKACNFAVDKVMARMRHDADIAMQRDADESDSEDSMYSMERIGSRPSDHYPYTKEHITKFFACVIHCIPLTISFDVTGLKPEDDKHCYCPCDKNMTGWRKRWELEGTVAGLGSPNAKCNLCTKGKLTPIGLMSHLRKEGESCILHFGIAHYMEHLYCKNEGSYRGGIGHKSMYQMNDSNWRAADSAHKKTLIVEIERGREALEEEKKKLRSLEEEHDKQANELDILKRTNKDQFEKLENLEEERKKLNVKKKEVVPELDGDALGRYKKALAAFFNTAKKSFTSVEIEKQDVDIKVQTEFKMQEYFDVCYDAPKNKNNGSLLFHTLDKKVSNKKVSNKKVSKGEILGNYHGFKIINKWNVKFANKATVRNEASKKDTTVDEGGPTREFLSQCWKQMGMLKILKKKEPGKKQTGVKLFEIQEDGTVPIADSILSYNLKKKFPDEEENADAHLRAKAYYRAIGRIMLHSLANGHTISASAMPPLYQNWLLRGCSPKDSDYHNDDVLQHLSDGGSRKQTFHSMVGKEHELADGTTEVVTNETIFTKVIPEQYLDSREQAFKHIQEGLTIDGDYSLCDFLRSFPLEAIQKITFSTPHLSAEDIIAALTPVYCAGWEQTGKDGKKFCIGSRAEHERKQETFFRESLCETLIEKEEKLQFKFLSLFVKFCTGYDYLPDKDGNPDFKIIVEFNFIESCEDAYPEAHTCDKTFKLPGALYSDGKKGFKKKLSEAVKIYGKNFSMA